MRRTKKKRGSPPFLPGGLTLNLKDQGRKVHKARVGSPKEFVDEIRSIGIKFYGMDFPDLIKETKKQLKKK